MSVLRQDTWGNLPLVTVPLQSMQVDRWDRPDSMFAGQMETLEHARASEWKVAEAERWAGWGAARNGARITVTFNQVVALALLAWAAAALFYFDPHLLLTVPIGLMTSIYLVTGLHKSWLLMRSEQDIVARAYVPSVGDPRNGAGEDLPLYTLLVPLRREGKMLPFLLRRLAAIDYPPERLEVILLVESDDDEMHSALSTCYLPPHIRPVTVPAGKPGTKPRALNVGLARARGEYIVVYDAEDRPEPDQLRKAVAAFRALPRRTICLQARLNFYNPQQSLLTRLFTVDYVLWYNGLLPGLTRGSACVPLGGTSNHFRIEALRRLGGWDPFNVTEDCDLGVRIARAGLQVNMLNSTTWEEAVTRVKPWVRQRSRWVKGYLQTYLVHMRHPIRLFREIGPMGFFDFQSLVGGSCFALLINPVMWALTVTYVLGKDTPIGEHIHALFPPALYYLALLCLVVGNFTFYYVNLYVCVRHGHEELTRYALLSPLYWLLMSIGAWAGLISLMRHPHYWAKTVHGESLHAVVKASAR